MELFCINLIKSCISCIYIYKEDVGIVKIFDFRFLTNILILECAEHDFTISTKCLSVYAFINFVAALEQKPISTLHEVAYLVATFVLITFWSIPLKKFRCSSKFLISLTQWYR